MRILFTGGSSFTGCWFARELAQSGCTLVCPLRRQVEDYTGVRRTRLDLLQQHVQLVPGMTFGSAAFLELTSSQPWDVLCHHAAEVTNYKSSDFDALAAVRNNTLNLPQVLTALRSGGNRPAVILTGTTFESGEGQGDPPLRAFSPYGLSKTLTWEVFAYYCAREALPLGKFVVPNPFGPLEEERFTSYLMNTWRSGRKAVVRTPDYVRDSIPVDLLARVYVGFVESVVSQKQLLSRCNPSGYVSTQREFAERLAREARPRTSWKCELEFLEQQDFSEPMQRYNLQPAFSLIPDWNESAFWDSFCAFYSQP